MLERYLQGLSLDEPDGEDLAATRERLKNRFPRGATRRMTQLGLLVGAALEDLAPQPDDALVYASAYAETRALEGYLDSFPAASPTLFQTSIHPSAVQQALISRQLEVGEFFGYCTAYLVCCYTPREWQKPHLPNLTGSPAAYRPPGSILGDARRPQVTGDYDAWTPGN